MLGQYLSKSYAIPANMTLIGECGVKNFLVWLAVLVLVTYTSQASGSGTGGKKRPQSDSSSVAEIVIGFAVGSDGKADGKVEVQSTAGKKQPDADKKADQAAQDVQVETRVFGKVITVGPDGKVEVKEWKNLEAALPKEFLDKLPQEARQQFEKALSGKKLEGGVTGKAKVVVIDPHGNRQEVETEFGQPLEGQPLDPTKEISEWLKKAGVDLPPEARAVLEGAKKAALSPGGKPVDVGTKLDQILERLERIEKELANLKNKNGT